MRKGIGESRRATAPFNLEALEELKRQGFLFVQVKGLTIDNHYDYIEPSKFILVPLRALPTEAADKDIYEAIDSQLLLAWALDDQSGVRISV